MRQERNIVTIYIYICDSDVFHHSLCNIVWDCDAKPKPPLTFSARAQGGDNATHERRRTMYR